MNFIKKIIGYPLAYICFGLGHLISFTFRVNLPLDINFYPLYTWFMGMSCDIQDYFGLSKPWTNTEK